MLQKAIPVLPANNIKETILFYEKHLGFSGVDEGGYVKLKKGAVEIHFFICNDKAVYNNSTCYIKVTDVQCLFSDFATSDMIQPKNMLKNLSGGKKMFCIKDNNGNELRFVQE